MQLANFTQTRRDCHAHLGYTFDIIEHLGANYSEFLSNYSISPHWTSNPVCEEVRQLVADQGAALRSMSLAQVYKERSDSQVDALLAQIDARVAYDEGYLASKLANMTLIGLNLQNNVQVPEEMFLAINASIKQMKACTAPGGVYEGYTCDSGLSISQDIALLRVQLVDDFTLERGKLQSWMTAQELNIDTNFKPMIDFYRAFRDVYNTVNGFASQLEEALDLQAGVTLSSIGFVNVNPVSVPGAPNIPSVGSFTGGLDSPDLTFEAMAPAFEGIDVDTANAQREFERMAEELKQAQVGWEVGFWDDYDPPGVGSNTTRKNWDTTSESFLPDIGARLQVSGATVTPPERPANTSGEIPSLNDTYIAERASQLVSALGTCGYWGDI